MNNDIIIFKDITKDGKIILKCSVENRNIYLGSKYNETKNIEGFINNLNIVDGEAIIIIIGLASGEYLKELIERLSEENKIIIIEPDENIYKLNLENPNIKKYIIDERVNYILYKDSFQMRNSIEEVIDKSYIPIINFGIYTNYNIVYKLQCNNVVNILNEYLQYINLLRNSNIQLRDKALKNYLINFKNIEKSVSAFKFKDIFKEKTAIIISSGPSLSKNIKDLKSFKDDIIIIAVARSLKEVLQNDIKPHFICAIDPGDIMLNLMKDNLECDVPIIVSEQTNGELLETYKGRKIFVLDSFKDIITKLAGEEYISLPNGGSVAHLATSFAVLTGVENIIFIGQDLAFTNMEYHSKSSTNESLINSQATFDKNSLVTIEGNCDPIVYSNSTFIAFKNWFERFIYNNKNVNYINATEGGAKINGTKVLTLKEALELYSHKSLDTKETINGILENGINNENKIIEFLQRELNILINMCKNGMNLSIEMSKYYYEVKGNISNMLKKLDEIDLRLERYKEIQYLINLVAYEDLEKIKLSTEYRAKLKESEKEKSIRISKRQIKIYETNLKAIKNIIDAMCKYCR